MPKYIDMTPTWEGVLPIYLDGIKNAHATGNGELLKTATEELKRMAQLADKWVEHCKAKQESK